MPPVAGSPGNISDQLNHCGGVPKSHERPKSERATRTGTAVLDAGIWTTRRSWTNAGDGLEPPTSTFAFHALNSRGSSRGYDKSCISRARRAPEPFFAGAAAVPNSL
jgi:hypothetical protein